MNESKKYIFLAFGELALDVMYDEHTIIKEVGGVSAFNTLYNLSVFGEEAYAIGGVGYDITDTTRRREERSAIKAIKTVESLKTSLVNTDNIQLINKPTNVFYIFKPKNKLDESEDLTINRVSPTTGKSSIEWSDKLTSILPQKFENKKVILIVSNFEPVTDRFINNTKKKCPESKISLDITNGKIFDKYSSEYLWKYLKKIDLAQCNENTSKLICKKLGVSSIEELVNNLNTEIFTLTKGSAGAIFYYRENGRLETVSKIPQIVEQPFDPTGAGDAFHTMMLLSYCKMKYNSRKIDKDYFDISFKLANGFARKVLQINGARGNPKELLEFMINEIKEIKKAEELEMG